MDFWSEAPTSSSTDSEGVAATAGVAGAATTGAVSTTAAAFVAFAFGAFAGAATAATTTGASTEATATGALAADFVVFVVVFAAVLILVLSEELIADMERGYLIRGCAVAVSSLLAKT